VQLFAFNIVSTVHFRMRAILCYVLLDLCEIFLVHLATTKALPLSDWDRLPATEVDEEWRETK